MMQKPIKMWEDYLTWNLWEKKKQIMPSTHRPQICVSYQSLLLAEASTKLACFLFFHWLSVLMCLSNIQVYTPQVYAFSLEIRHTNEFFIVFSFLFGLLYLPGHASSKKENLAFCHLHFDPF